MFMVELVVFQLNQTFEELIKPIPISNQNGLLQVIWFRPCSQEPRIHTICKLNPKQIFAGI